MMKALKTDAIFIAKAAVISLVAGAMFSGFLAPVLLTSKFLSGACR
jgi:hypothetical protein